MNADNFDPEILEILHQHARDDENKENVHVRIPFTPSDTQSERPVTPLPGIYLNRPELSAVAVASTEFVRPPITITSPGLPRRIVTRTRRLTQIGGSPTRRTFRDQDPNNRWYAETDSHYVIVGVNRRHIHRNFAGVWWGNIVARQHSISGTLRFYERVEFAPSQAWLREYPPS